MSGLADRARGWAHGLRQLRRWAGEDPAALREDIELAIALAEPPVEPMLRAETRTTHRCPAPGAPRGVICSRATGPHVALLSIALPTLLDYGDRHGWDVVVSTEAALAEGRPASWGKLPLIRELLGEYDLVWWIDADALIVDGTVDIRTELRDGKDLYCVEHHFPWPHGFAASAGVMLWRRSAWSLGFLDELWDRTDRIDHPVWENAALLDLLGYSLEPFGHPFPTAAMHHVQLLSPDWNSVWPDPAEHPRVHHHGGAIPFADRRRFMLLDLARVRRGQAPSMEGPLATRPDRAPGPRRLLTEAHPAAVMSRADLPRLLTERGLTGTGVEVGVYAGEFSARLLWSWPGERLVSVDPWTAAPEDEYVDISNLDQAGFDVLLATTRARLDRFGDRSEVWRLTSREAAAKIEDGSVDFVYIDARHDEASVADDLALWYPKVRPGGILAGHDYLDGDLPEGRFGVKSAVDAFVAARGIPLHVTGEPTFPSWIVEIPSAGP